MANSVSKKRRGLPVESWLTNQDFVNIIRGLESDIHILVNDFNDMKNKYIDLQNQYDLLKNLTSSSNTVPKNKQQINISQFAKGEYLVKTYFKEKEITNKILIK